MIENICLFLFLQKDKILYLLEHRLNSETIIFCPKIGELTSASVMIL